MLQLSKAATPATTVTAFVVQLSVPGPPLVGVPVRMPSVTTVELSAVSVLPFASSMRTNGWLEKGVPPSTVAGGVVLHVGAAPQQISILLAAPAPMLNAGPVTPVTPVAAAVIV